MKPYSNTITPNTTASLKKLRASLTTAEKVRAYRRAQDWTQVQMCDNFCLHYRQYRDFENGKLTQPEGMAGVVSLAEKAEVSVAALGTIARRRLGISKENAQAFLGISKPTLNIFEQTGFPRWINWIMHYWEVNGCP